MGLELRALIRTSVSVIHDVKQLLVLLLFFGVVYSILNFKRVAEKGGWVAGE